MRASARFSSERAGIMLVPCARRPGLPCACVQDFLSIVTQFEGWKVLDNFMRRVVHLCCRDELMLECAAQSTGHYIFLTSTPWLQIRRNHGILSLLVCILSNLNSIYGTMIDLTRYNRRRNNRLHNRLLPHSPPHLQPRLPQNHHPRSSIHCVWRFRKGWRPPSPLGIPCEHCTSILRSTHRTSKRTRWSETMGIQSCALREYNGEGKAV